MASRACRRCCARCIRANSAIRRCFPGEFWIPPSYAPARANLFGDFIGDLDLRSVTRAASAAASAATVSSTESGDTLSASTPSSSVSNDESKSRIPVESSEPFLFAGDAPGTAAGGWTNPLNAPLLLTSWISTSSSESSGSCARLNRTCSSKSCFLARPSAASSRSTPVAPVTPPVALDPDTVAMTPSDVDALRAARSFTATVSNVKLAERAIGDAGGSSADASSGVAATGVSASCCLRRAIGLGLGALPSWIGIAR